MTATQEWVVPRSMPICLLMAVYLVERRDSNAEGDVRPCGVLQPLKVTVWVWLLPVDSFRTCVP